ncbi:MAG: PLP-dependent aminotransferase family protein [Actinomycetota bacterium]
MRLAEVLGDWSSGTGSLYAQLADGLREAINRGDLRPGTVLPAERGLARALAVSRTTVVAALDVLKRIGYLDSRSGSGTWVRRVREFELAGGVTAPAAGIGRNPLFRNLGSADSSMVDLTAAVPDPPPQVAEALREASNRAAAHVHGPGYFPLGLPALRQAVAERFTQRGIPTVPEEVMITAGAQQAITILAAAYVQPGTPVLMENPSYPGAIESFRMLGASVRTVAVGSEGLLARDVIRAIEARPPEMIYLIPSFHNPTGTFINRAERARLRRYLAGRGIAVVEDESTVELALDGEEPPPPVGLEPGGEVSTLIVGSASKPFWGGIRIGWIRASSEVIELISRHKLVFDLATAIPSQVAAEILVRKSPSILPERRSELAQRFQYLVSRLASELPEWSVTRPSGGVTAWVRLPDGNATQFSQVAIRHGVAVVAGPFFDAHGNDDDHIRIPYLADTDTLDQGVKRLAEAWSAMRRPGTA